MALEAHVLVIDDNATNIAILEEILEDDGFELTTAMSGEEALECYAERRPDLILLDIMMPGIDGYETCRQIRELPGGKDTKIIMVSAKALTEERIEGYEAGADDYIIKPFDEQELLSKVRVYARLGSLESVDRLKGQVLNLLGHGTRTPLNGILPVLDLVIADPELDVETRTELLKGAQRSAKRLHRLLERANHLSRLRAGDVTFQVSDVAATLIVQEAIDKVAPYAKEMNVTLKAGEVCGAQLHAEHFATLSALVDVVDNAVRYGPENGSVVVTADISGDAVVFHVQDEGTGIPREQVNSVLGSFDVADLNHHTTGQAMGLAIVNEVCLQQRGGLKFEEGIVSLNFPMSSSTGENKEDAA
ncbi:MAG: hybrid sensor histidine kinase/response regulator [Deltaproteobacteria bacterium]|nr:hybrid sensor histidine kinase/response regulator [Deltaproteobacteria bacterium]